MAQIEITSETESDGGWTFAVQALDDRGSLHRCELHLSWADYNHWSPGGSDPPARVAEAVMSLLLSHQSPADLKSRFDASLLRRLDPDADDKLPRLISR